MKILLSNDDGIEATGISVLRDLLLGLGHEVFLIAPLKHQSGKSHAITLYEPLMVSSRYKDGEFYGMAVDGFPVDCTRLGLIELCQDVDIVVTGINHGYNIGPAMYYSGTIAAAFEGILHNKPSLAFSLNSFKDEDMAPLRKQMPKFMEILLNECTESLLYNINIPCVKKIKGIKPARQSMLNFADYYEKRNTPLNKDYYWLHFSGFKPQPFAKIPKRNQKYQDDVTLIREGYITITPMQYDLTNYDCLKKLQKKFEV